MGESWSTLTKCATFASYLRRDGFIPQWVASKSDRLLASDDADENPYELNFSGIGISARDVWRESFFGTVANTGNTADLADPDHAGQSNLVEYPFGMDPLISLGFGLLNPVRMPQISIIHEANGPVLSPHYLWMRTDAPEMRTDGPGMRTDEPGMWTDEPGMRTDEPGMRTDAPGMRTDEPEMWTDAPGMRTDAPGMRTDEPGMWTDEPGMWTDEPGMWTNRPGRWND